MTSKEEQALARIEKTINDINNANIAYRSMITDTVNKLSDKVESKHIPISIESDILRTVQTSMDAAIKSALSGYNSPLTKLVEQVVSNHNTELKTLINDSFEQVIRTEDFKTAIVSAFSHKVARSIISNNNGLYDKVANELKQDASFKAKMTLAVANVVNECLAQRKIS